MILRRRAEVLVPGIDRLWAALKKEGAADSDAVEQSLDAASRLSREQEDFDPAKFAAALEQLAAAFKRASEP